MSEFLTIVRAVYSGLSRRKVAAMHKVSRNTVSLYLRQARDQGWLTLEDLEKLDGLTVSQGVSQIASPSRDASFRMPDFGYVHSELAKPHVTLKLLWEEYAGECRRNSERFYMETQFRRYYHKHAKVHKATIRLEHKPALTLEADWAGTRIAFFGEESGKPEEGSLFVAVLPCTRIIYAGPFRDEKLPSWISGHAHAFQRLGGVPKTLVPDNLKCGVKRANFYEPDLNRTYQEMAAHYGTVILPARVRKPKDKPSAENAVLIASRKIIAGLRNVQILSFADLQRHVRSGLEQVNSAPLAGKSESRWTSFLAEEKDFLLPLLQSPYEPAEWGKAKVQPNCHVACQRKFYSVPFEHQRIESHRRFWGLVSRARFQNTTACSEDIRYDDGRRLDRGFIMELASCNYIPHARNVLAIGPAGAGKSFLAQALGQAACRHMLTTRYVQLPDLLDELKIVKRRDLEAFNRLRKQIVKFDLLIIDEWLLFPLLRRGLRDTSLHHRPAPQL